MGKYLSKADTKAFRVLKRRVRVAEGSRGWAPRQEFVTYVTAGGVRCNRSGVPHERDCDCVPNWAQPARAAAIVRCNRKHWEAQLADKVVLKAYTRYCEAMRAYTSVCASYGPESLERRTVKGHLDKTWRNVQAAGYGGTRKTARLILGNRYPPLHVR